MNDWLSIHKLEHKRNKTSDRKDFDALFTAGCGDYIKLSKMPDDSWQAEGTAFRSYREEAIVVLVPWLVEVASRDNLCELPPIVEQTNLLRLKKATQKANAALKRDIATVYFPLGMPAKEIRNINLLKASAFICKDEQQFRKLEKAFGDFKQDNHCGVELLALRQSYGNRSQGSILDLAERVFELVSSGDTKFVRALNLNRLSTDLRLLSQARGGQIRARKEAADQELFRDIDVQSAECSSEILTGYLMRKE